MGNPNYFGFDATDAKFQVASASLACTFTDAGDLVTDNDHGLANGAQVVFQTIVTTTGISTFTRYYVISSTTNTFQVATTYGGSAVVLTSDGSGTYKAITEYDIYFVNKLSLANELKSFTYEGDGTSRKRTKLTGVTVNLEADCVSEAARISIFSKTAVSSALPDSYTYGVYEGETSETGGATVGLWVEGTATRVDASTAAESTVTLRRWFPLGVVTYSGAPDVNTGDKWGTDKYEFVASKTTVDVCAGALPATVPSGGVYQILMEK